MNRGLYNTASAILSLHRNMDVKAHNISNVNTVGYKYSNVHNDVFEEVMLSYKGNNLGIMPTRVGIDKITTVFDQGNFMTTERKLDVAIQGDGFIKVDRGNGQYSYTRNGSFNIDRDGFLVDFNGNYIIGENGRINLKNAKDITFKPDGTIIADRKVAGKLYITELDGIVKQGNTYFRANKELPTDSSIHQGYLETSNVDSAKELTDIISLQRLITSNTKMLQTQDELNEKMINGISR